MHSATTHAIHRANPHRRNITMVSYGRTLPDRTAARHPETGESGNSSEQTG
jgi:hypothetical protein